MLEQLEQEVAARATVRVIRLFPGLLGEVPSMESCALHNSEHVQELNRLRFADDLVVYRRAAVLHQWLICTCELNQPPSEMPNFLDFRTWPWYERTPWIRDHPSCRQWSSFDRRTGKLMFAWWESSYDITVKFADGAQVSGATRQEACRLANIELGKRGSAIKLTPP